MTEALNSTTSGIYRKGFAALAVKAVPQASGLRESRMELWSDGVLDGPLAMVGIVVAQSGRDPQCMVPAGANICNWLSRDPSMVDAFPNDPRCFSWLQPAVAEFFFPTATDLADPFRNIRRDLPIYLFSGTEDPVG